jgi:hypothetical protein
MQYPHWKKRNAISDIERDRHRLDRFDPQNFAVGGARFAYRSPRREHVSSGSSNTLPLVKNDIPDDDA